MLYRLSCILASRGLKVNKVSDPKFSIEEYDVNPKRNMKKILLICCYLLGLISLKAQIIHVENGINVSKFVNKELPVFTLPIRTYISSIGIDYWEHPYWFLTSDCSFFQRGGEERGMKDEEGKELIFKESKKYLALSTSINAKYTFQNVSMFIGAGPKVDLLLENAKMTNIFFHQNEFKRACWGIKPRAGIYNKFKSNIVVGLNVAYIIDFTPIMRSKWMNHRNVDFFCCFSIGYSFK